MTSRLTNGSAPHEATDQARSSLASDEDEDSEQTRFITPTEVSMLEMARQWAPFGGADSEKIFVAFGISRSQF